MADFDSDQAEIDAMSIGPGLNAISGINGDNVSNTDLNNNIGGLRSSVNVLSQNIAAFSKTVVSASKQLGEGVNNQIQFDPKTYMIRNSLASSGPIGAIITKAIQDSGLGAQVSEGIKSKLGGLFSKKYDSQSGYLSPQLMTQSVTDGNALVVKELHQNVASQLIEANQLAQQELNESKRGNESIVAAIGKLENSTITGQNKVTGAGSSTSNNVVTAIGTLQSALLNALKDIQLSISGGQNGRTGQVHSGISNVNNSYNQGGGGSVDNSDVLNAIGQLGSKLQEAPEGKMSTAADFIFTATKVGTLFRGKYVNDIRKTGNPLTTQVSALLEIYRWQRLYGELTKKQFNEIIRLMGGEQKDVVGKHGLLKETFLRNKDAIKKRLGKVGGFLTDFAMFDLEDIDDKARASMAYGLNKSLRENEDDKGLVSETLASLPLIGRIAKNRLHKAGKQTMYDYANEIHNTEGGAAALVGSQGMSYEDRLKYEDAMSRRGDFVSAVEDTKNGTRSNETIFDKLGKGVALEPNPLYDKTLPNLIAGSVPVTIMGYADGVCTKICTESLTGAILSSPETTKTGENKPSEIGPVSVSESVPDKNQIQGIEKAENISDAAIAASSSNDDQNTVLLRSINQHLEGVELSSGDTSKGIVEVAKAEQTENAENEEERHRQETERRYESSRKKKGGKKDLLSSIWKTIKLLGMIAGALALGKALLDPDSVPGKMLNWSTKLIQWGYKAGKSLGGFPGAIIGALTGVWMTRHPIKTIKGIKKGIQGIWNAPKTIRQKVRDAKAGVKKYKRSRAQDRGRWESVKATRRKPLRGPRVTRPSSAPQASRTPTVTRSPSASRIPRGKGAPGITRRFLRGMKGKKGKWALISGLVAATGVGAYEMTRDKNGNPVEGGFGGFDDIDFDLDGTVPGSMPVSIVGIADDLNLGIGVGGTTSNSGGSGKPSGGPVSVEKSQKTAEAYSKRTEKLQDRAYAEAKQLAKKHEEETKYDNNLIWKGDALSTGLNVAEKATDIGLATAGVKALANGGNLQHAKNVVQAVKNAPAKAVQGTVNAVNKTVDAGKGAVQAVKNVKNVKDAVNLAKGAGGVVTQGATTVGKTALKALGPALVAVDVGMDTVDAVGRFKEADSIGEAFENGAVAKSAIGLTKAASLAFPPAYLAAMAGDAVLSKVDAVNENIAQAQEVMDAGSVAFMNSLKAAKEKSSKLPHMIQFADAVFNYDERINEIGKYKQIARDKRAEADKDRERWWFNQDYAKQAALDNEAAEAISKASGVNLLHYGIGTDKHGKALPLQWDKKGGIKNISNWKWIPKDKDAKKNFVLNAIERLKKEGYLEKDFHPALQQKIDEITGVKDTVKHIYDGSGSKPIYTDGMKPASDNIVQKATEIHETESKTLDAPIYLDGMKPASNNVVQKATEIHEIHETEFKTPDVQKIQNKTEPSHKNLEPLNKTTKIYPTPKKPKSVQENKLQILYSLRNEPVNSNWVRKWARTYNSLNSSDKQKLFDRYGIYYTPTNYGASYIASSMAFESLRRSKTGNINIWERISDAAGENVCSLLSNENANMDQIKYDMNRTEELKKINDYETQKKALENVNTKIEETSKKQINASNANIRTANNNLTNIYNTMNSGNNQQLDTFYPLPKTLTVGNIT